jgi:uncharacterized Zn-binding protein involved in type VI secretion
MAGVCRLGDRAKAPVDVHGCPACPHPNVTGPAISASSNVNVNGMPALRMGDIGMHIACCGTNMWKVISASGQVFINGAQMVRVGDPTQHCGGLGKMIEGSGNVTDNSPLTHGGPFGGLPLPPPLPPNQVRVYPNMAPTRSHDEPPGLPMSGGPQIYDQAAAEREKYANMPHASAGPSDAEKAAGWHQAAANYWLAGNKEGFEHATAEEQRYSGISDYESVKAALEVVIKSARTDAGARKAAQDKLDKIENLQRALRSTPAPRVRSVPPRPRGR